MKHKDNSVSTPSNIVVSFVGNKAVAQKSGMVFAPDLTERSWEKIGSSLRELTNSSSWWLADWLIFGEASYGWRRYTEAVERTGLDYQTLRNYAWVARKFEQHRRRDSLSFAHHAEVTSLSPSEQDYWLRKAEEKKWSRNELRKAVRASLAEQRVQDANESGSDTVSSIGVRAVGSAADLDSSVQDEVRQEELPATLIIELPADQLDLYAKQAAQHGLDVNEWAVQILDAARQSSLLLSSPLAVGSDHVR